MYTFFIRYLGEIQMWRICAERCGSGAVDDRVWSGRLLWRFQACKECGCLAT